MNSKKNIFRNSNKNSLIIFMKSIGVFIFLNICNVVCCFALSIIAPFFPTYAKNKGLDLDLIGYIFSLYPLG